MSIGYHSPLDCFGPDPEEGERAYRREQARLEAEAWQARLLAAARTGDGHCLGLADAAGKGYSWCDWVPGPGDSPVSAEKSAERIEAAFALREEQQARVARVAKADPDTAPDADLLARWIEHGQYGVKARELRQIEAWIDAGRYTPAAAPINNPFAALAALKGTL